MKLVILGPPGAGKGTQADFVSAHYGIPHISTGSLLRDNMKRQTKLGKEISKLVETGKLVPDEIITDALKERLGEPDCANGFLLDGYPRTVVQAEKTESIAGELDEVVAINVEDDVIIERLSGRRMCESCGANFHITFKQPLKDDICDNCGGRLVQRDDDKESTVQKRLKIYHDETEPVIDFFEKRGKLAVVDGVGEINKISEMIIAAIDN